MRARHRELPLEGRGVANRVRRSGGPPLELLLELAARAELTVVVEVDVRDDGDLGREAEHRAVGLVTLDDEPALPRARVAAELRNGRTDQPRRVATGLA